jgi:hypothetical protein
VNNRPGGVRRREHPAAPFRVDAPARAMQSPWCMGKTRLSLYYVATYLLLTGISLVAAPKQALSLLGAERTYDLIFVRSNGAFMIALGTLVAQIIRHRVEVLYATTLVVRVMFLSVFAWLYALTEDRLFIVILGVVGFGFLLTFACYVADRRAARAAPTPA